MKRYPESRYIVLQEDPSEPERHMIEHSISAVLPVVRPSNVFVDELGQDLIAEAKLRHARAQRRYQILRTLSVVSGSILPIAGGVLLWALSRRRQGVRHGILSSNSLATVRISAGRI